MPKINLSISLDEGTSAVVDQLRGDVTRSRWVTRAVQQRVEREAPHLTAVVGGGLPAAPPGPVTSADAQGAIKPDLLGLDRPTRTGRRRKA